MTHTEQQLAAAQPLQHPAYARVKPCVHQAEPVSLQKVDGSDKLGQALGRLQHLAA